MGLTVRHHCVVVTYEPTTVVENGTVTIVLGEPVRVRVMKRRERRR